MTIAIKTGSLVLDTYTGILSGGAQVSASQYDCIELPMGTNYAVPSANELVITKIFTYSTNASGEYEFGYGDTAVDDSAAAPTNYVALCPRFVCLVANVVYEHDVVLRVPTGKYPHLVSKGYYTRSYVMAYLRSTA